MMTDTNNAGTIQNLDEALKEGRKQAAESGSTVAIFQCGPEHFQIYLAGDPYPPRGMVVACLDGDGQRIPPRFD